MIDFYKMLMKALKCKPSAQFAYNYSINVLSKCSNIISHRSSKVDRHIDHRSSKVDTSTINLRRSTHQSSIFEGRHIDHRSSKVDTSIIDHRSSKVDTSIFEDRRRKHRTDNLTSHRQFVTKYRPQRRSIVLVSDEATHARAHMYLYIVHVYTATATPRVTPHVY